MTLSGNSEIQRIIGAALAARPYSHSQRAEPNVTAVITVEDDLRYLPRTFRAVLAQSVLPSTIVIADCSGRTVQSVQTSFEIIPTKEDVLETMPEPQRISIQIVRVAQARSFADAVAKVLRNAQVDTSTKTLWLLHDESRPADERCLERLLDAWANSPTAALLGAKQLDWEGRALHDVGCYAARGRVVSLVVDGEPDQEQYDGRRDVFSVSLAGALVPVNTLAAVHGVNPWFGTFDESEDFCRRLCLSGRRVVVVPGARIAHRRARYDGVRTRDGGAIEPDAAVDSSMAQLVGAQKYAMTDMAAPWWPLLWVVSLAAALVGAVSLLFRKRPYRAMCRLVMPWAALVAVPGALAARHR
ncbi:glycosyltransferase family 2 protein, partial [Bifidobacterium choerinum]